MSMLGTPFEAHDVVRVGLVGTGGRQRSLLRNLVAMDGVEITAICDVDSEQAALAKEIAAAKGPGQVFNRYDDMLARDDIDLVMVATPWDEHTANAVAAMEAGKHVAVEVPAATTTEECWQLVDTSERTGRHCVMLENCCYGYNELLVLNLVQAGRLGALLHGEAAYLHDLRAMLFSRPDQWRRRHHTFRDGNLYPTHGLGPVAMYMAINRGDRFETLVSMSSPQRGLDEWRKEHLPADSPMQQDVFACGDINTSLIKTAHGRTIMLQHTVVNPRPYSRINLIEGTRGVFTDYPARIYIEEGDAPEEFTDLEPYKQEFEHPLWTEEGERARRLGGHGGMDFIMLHRLVERMRAGEVPDMDVYDAAAWSVPGPLSEDSVRTGSSPVQFPDFTRGAWSTARPTLAELP